ncbi:hypothetical protein T01_7133 [Trichinella spiralis]|uniref:5'-AMP-activated protein kinase subunit beta-1 n=1 Tax=Trichinella spiralis TaxID=6334 RepID=A0A0V1AXD9_TRISP|nr:hypothetical protein T01_7133 [Trichinella spiralis]
MIVALLKNETEASACFLPHHSRVQIGISFLSGLRRRRRHCFWQICSFRNNLNTVAMASAGGKKQPKLFCPISNYPIPTLPTINSSRCLFSAPDTEVVGGKKFTLQKRQFGGNFRKFIQMETPTAENVVQVSTGVLECPLEKDGTLSLATLRSLLPGARGLWYKPSEFKPIQSMENRRNLYHPIKDGVIEYITSVFVIETNICPYFGSCLSAIKCPEMHREFQRFITTFKRSASNCSEKDFHDSGITESTSDYCSSSFHDLSEADLSSDSIPYDLYVRQKRCSDPAIECAEKSVRLVKQSQRLLELENEIAELKKLVNESNTTTSRTKQSERKASIECCDSCRNICKNYQMLLDQKGQDIELLLEGYARNRRLIGELSKVGSGNQDELKDDQKEKILQQMEDIWKQCTEKFQLPRDDKSATDKDDQIEMVVMTESNAEQIDKSDKKKRLESDFESSERALFASEPVKWSGNIVNTWVMTENAEKLKSADQEDVAKLRYKRSLSVERDQDPNKTDTTTTTTTTATEAIERKMVADRSSAMIVDTSAEDECNKWKAMCENLQDHLDKQNKQIAEFTRLMDWIEDESETLQEGLRKLEKKMASGGETVGQLESRKTGANDENIDEMKKDVKPTTAEACNKLQDELNELKSKCKNLSQKLHDGNLNFEESAPLVDVDEFKKRYKEKKQRCIELESALEDKEAQLDRIKRENDKLQMDIQLIQQQFNEMNEPLANVEEESKMKLPDSTEVHTEDPFNVKQQSYEECFGENLDNPYHTRDAEYQLKRIGESETALSRRKWSEDKLNMIADLQNQLNDQRQQLLNLEEERSRINEQLNQAKARCEQLENERENVSQIEQLQKCIQNLEIENEKLKLQTIEQSQQTNAGGEIPPTTAKKEAVDELSSELYQTYQRKYTLEMELEKAKQQAANASAELASEQQARRVEQDELLAWQKKVEDLKAAFARVDKDRLDLQQMYDEKNSAFATVEDELESVRRQLSALKGSSAALGEGEIQDAAEEERRRLNDEIVTLQAQLSEASDKANWYAGEVGYFKQKLEEAYNKIGRLEDQLKIFQSAAAVGQNLSSADADEVANLKEQLNRLNVELGTVRKELQKETDRANWYHGEVEYFRSMQKNIEEKLCNLIKKITNNSDANVNAEAALQQLNNVYECIQVDISTLMDKAKWYEGEKEYFKKEMEKFSEKCIELQDQNICNASQFEDAFIVNKEPYVDRQKWILSMLKLKKENMRHVQFEITAPHSHQVYLVGSFYNWECALLMHQRPNEKWELGLDVPVGRHEFRFIQNGQWCTDEQYATCPNDYGTLNNWLIVE